MTHPKDPLEPIQFPVAPGSSETVKAPPSPTPSTDPSTKNPSKQHLPNRKSPTKKPTPADSSAS